MHTCPVQGTGLQPPHKACVAADGWQLLSGWRLGLLPLLPLLPPLLLLALPSHPCCCPMPSVSPRCTGGMRRRPPVCFVYLLNPGANRTPSCLLVPRQVSDLYDPREQWASYILNAIKAKELFIRDVSYIVRANEVRGMGVWMAALRFRLRCVRGDWLVAAQDGGSAVAVFALQVHVPSKQAPSRHTLPCSRALLPLCRSSSWMSSRAAPCPAAAGATACTRWAGRRGSVLARQGPAQRGVWQDAGWGGAWAHFCLLLPAWPDSMLLLCFTQAIEAKEGLEIQNESVTLASISYQVCEGGLGPAFLLNGWLAGPADGWPPGWLAG